jgi:hypothetical protein
VAAPDSSSASRATQLWQILTAAKQNLGKAARRATLAMKGNCRKISSSRQIPAFCVAFFI